MSERTIMPNGRYTDDELNLLKNVFAENLPLIKILRKVMLQLSMTEGEEVEWRKTFKGEINDLMRKMFLPTIDGDAPIDQTVDLYLTLDLSNRTEEENISNIKSREIVIDYLDKQLEVLSNGGQQEKLLSQFNLKNIEELRARNTILMHTESVLRETYGLGGFKAETPEETLARLKKASNK